MKDMDQKFFSSRESFRKWLKENHNTSPGIWMIYYKKHVAIDSVSYREALEEALCFGWIDSIIKKIDNDRYARKFTPRSNTSNWSEINRKLFSELVNKGLMTEAGLKKYGISGAGSDETRTAAPLKLRKSKNLGVPDYILKEFAENEPALKNFNALALSHKRNYVLWITTAKREETIKNRIAESIRLLRDNKKLGLK